ncbi:MAG: hypothetical protein HC890_15095, partial [Chloroflexaceae bacterium]|nr:hypothetical protein [Chloroflexaceae bacterium]
MTAAPIPICIVLGTRPEAIKLAPVIQVFRHSEVFRSVVVLTGQHREMVTQVMELFALRGDYDLEIMQPRQPSRRLPVEFAGTRSR